MKNIRWTAPFRAAVILTSLAGFAAAAPYGPEGRATSWTQPDGTVLDLRVFGDEYYARTETAEGFTVVYNREDNSYHYADIAADGSALVPTGNRVEIDVKPPTPAHLELAGKRIAEISRTRRAETDGVRTRLWRERVQAVRAIHRAESGGIPLVGPVARFAKIKAAPVTGNLHGLTILAQFPDDPATGKDDTVDFPTSQTKIVNFCNEPGYNEDGNAGSVRDYFFDQSLGLLDYTQTVTPIITLPHPRAYYNYEDYPTSTRVRPNAGASGRLLLTDAIAELVALNFDFSGLSVDAQGNALATNIFFAGKDSGVFAQGLWPHQFNLGTPVNVGTFGKPVRIYNYQITNNKDSSPVIGTFCHENGHLILGYPDIYSSFPTGQGVGEHCLMGSGNYLDGGRTPSPINAYFKDLVGWEKVTEIGADEFSTRTLPTTGNVSIRIRKPGIDSEFFMVENRGNGDRWAQYSRDKGIAIWHIDESISGNTDPDADHYQVSLEQADGKFDLERGLNRGDGGDLFDSSTTAFSDDTQPDANWWDQTDSGIRIEPLSLPARRMSVAFGAVPPNTIIVTNPNGGEILYPGSIYTVQWLANIVGKVKIDLYQDGKFLSRVVAATGNDGFYEWQIPEIAGGPGFSLRISSISNPVPTKDFSDAPFSVSTSSFPYRGQIPHGWTKRRSADEAWKVTKQEVYEGKHALSPGKIGDGKTASLKYRSHFRDGRVSFYMKVSSERGFDFGRFFIDEVEQQLTTGTARGMSGEEDWGFHAFAVSAGYHTFKWTYEKDDSYGDLLDSVWIDGVNMPETTQEIEVADAGGTDLKNGAASYDFGSGTVGKSGQTRTFTIHNSGRADLANLRVKTAGDAAGDFIVTGLDKDFLKRGKSVTLNVRFSPQAAGGRNAQLRIYSNDTDESVFTIGMTGTAQGLPEIGVSLGKRVLADAQGTRNFGHVALRSRGKTRKFTITNDGGSKLRRISISRHGKNRRDFKVRGPSIRVVAPGESVTFKVTFSPNKTGKRRASIHIRTNDPGNRRFVLNLAGTGKSGTGKGGKAAAAPLLASVSGRAAARPAGTNVEVVDGRKYLAITIPKTNGKAPAGTVEVSADLLDWSSGARHTTVVTDNAEILKVRDNTPVTPDSKRFIRLD